MKNKINQKESRSICFLKYIGIAVGVVLLSSWSAKASSFVVLQQEQQQQTFKEITGVVKTEYGVPISSVAVLLVGSNQGTKTDEEGKYTIKAKPYDRLKFVSEGFKTTTMTVSQSNILNATMMKDDAELSNIIIEDYRNSTEFQVKTVTPNTVRIEGTPSHYAREMMKTRAMNGVTGLNIATESSVKPSVVTSVFECRYPNRNFIQLLQGQMVSIDFSRRAASDYKKPETILKDVEALTRNGNYTYVVDGVRVSEETYRSLNQNDIESVDIYKHSDITQVLRESQSKTTFKAR